MSGYDPFVELFPGEPILDGVTTEGIFPVLVAALTVNIGGKVEATVQVVGSLTHTHILIASVDTVVGVVGGFLIPNEIIGAAEAAAEVDGSTLTVTADLFVGWGIPVGVA